MINLIRILHVISSLDCGGAETFVMNYYRHINRQLVQFDFFINAAHKCYYEDEVRSLGGRIFRQKVKIRRPITNAYQLMKCLKEHPEFKIIHIHTYLPSSVRYVFFAMLCGIKIRIVHSHSNYSDMSVVEKLLKPLLRVLATNWLACSAEAGTAVFGNKSIKNKKFILSQNAIDVSQFDYNPERRMVVRRELAADNHYVLLNVGRLDYAKNQTFLLDVFAFVRQKCPGIILLIAGSGPLEEALRKKTDVLGLGDMVRFLGLRADISDLLQAADLFVFPSLFEGFGIAALEAQTAGLPCLLSDTIPKEVSVIGDLVTFLPIDQGVQPWADAIKSAVDNSYPRINNLDEIRRLGYDINDAALNMQNFYMEKVGEYYA